MNQTKDVLFSNYPGTDGDLGIITLNRPSVLNSLNHHIISAMYQQLQAWEQDEKIKAVIITAAPGRAFCAGGDLRLTYQRYQENDPQLFAFFRDEYQLNQLIHFYSKPYIAFLNGITMGGGVGISIHGSHRIATENLIFAMPETGIGFFPDVGGTYFLPRLPQRVGYYLGLTGATLSADDCTALGITQLKINSSDWDNVLNALAITPFKENAKESVTSILRDVQIQNRPQAALPLELIAEIFSTHSLEEVYQRLEKPENEFAKKTLQMLNKKSPTSLKVTLAAFTRTLTQTFPQAMQQEYHLTEHFLRAHDFMEGIRAVIIDKDQNPQWQPGHYSEVTDDLVAGYFDVSQVTLQAGSR